MISPSYQVWLKLAALVLVLAALGLPINDLFRYALLVIAAVLTGRSRSRPTASSIIRRSRGG